MPEVNVAEPVYVCAPANVTLWSEPMVIATVGVAPVAKAKEPDVSGTTLYAVLSVVLAEITVLIRSPDGYQMAA
jgi:hypothetical protein